MSVTSSRPDDAAEMRKRAEELVAQIPEDAGMLPPEKVQRLLHELRVHQVELEMQNEELRRVQLELDASRARYFDLYNLAPVGYLSISEQGLILEINLTAATLLGLARSALVKHRLSSFILPDDQDIYYMHRKLLFETGTRQVCEIRMLRQNAPPFWVRFEATTTPDETGLPICLAVMSDITELKRQEEELRSLHLRHEAILASVPDIIMQVDSNKRYVWANQAGLEFFGEDVLGKEASFYFIGEQRTYETVQPLFEGNEEAFHFESWQRRKNGQTRLLSWWCRVLKDIEGNVTGALSSAQDITEHRQAEEALRVSEEKFRSVFEHSVEGKSLTTMDGKLKANMALCQLLGYSEYELSQLKWRDITHPDDIDRDQEINNSIVSGERATARWTKRYYRKDGCLIWADIGTTLQRDYAGEPLYFITSVIDVTERKRAEEALLKSEHRLRRVHESGMLGVIYWNMNGKIIDSNDKFLEMVGYTRDDLESGKIDWINMTPPEYRHLDEISVKELKTTGANSTPIEKEYIRKDGTRISIIVTGAMLDEECYNGVAFVLDITERKRAEVALRRSQVLLSQAEEMGKVGGWEFDIRTKQQTWTDMVYKIHEIDVGCQPTLAQSLNFYTPASRPIIERAVLKAIEQGEPFDLELDILTAKGNLRSVHAIGRADLAHGRVFGFFQDITERVQAERALRESEEKYRLVSENTNDWVYWIAPDRTLRYISPSCERVTSYSPEEFISHPGLTLEIVHPEDRGAVERHLIEAELSDVPDSMEFRIVTKTGEVRWIEHACSPIYTEAGGRAGRRGTNRDITERKLAENALRTSEARYRMVQDIGHVGSWEHDIQSATFWGSDESKRIYGFDPDQPVFSVDEVEKCIPEKERVHQALVDLIETDKPYNLEFEIHPRNGAGPRIIASIAELQRNEHGDPLKVMGVIQDVTDRKRAEEEIRRLNEELEQRVIERTAQLEAANKELEAFSYSVSHDLRAPLRGMNGFSQILLEDYADLLDDKGREHLQRIRAGSQRMSQLINDMLSLSRAARHEMVSRTVDLSAMAAEIITELQSSQPERQVEFAVAPGLVVKADPNLIHIALENLLNNAWKFTSKHPTARIELGVLPTPTSTYSDSANEGPDEVVTFFVRDDGAGFDMEHSSKLFGAFQRLHPTTEFSGTGIGLATVQRVIHRHGGRVWAEAAVENGTTIYFTIPQRREVCCMP